MTSDCYDVPRATVFRIYLFQKGCILSRRFMRLWYLIPDFSCWKANRDTSVLLMLLFPFIFYLPKKFVFFIHRISKADMKLLVSFSYVFEILFFWCTYKSNKNTIDCNKVLFPFSRDERVLEFLRMFYIVEENIWIVIIKILLSNGKEKYIASFFRFY